MTTMANDVRVIDADTHYTEPPDLWTSRAPAEYKDRVLHVEDRDGIPTWVVDGVEIGFARGGGVVDPQGGKLPFLESMEKGIDWVHPGAWDPKARLQVMDECGIHAQVLFPNVVGLGGHTLNTVVQDEALRILCVEIYNDAMAQIQEESNMRFLPMPVLPSWDVDRCVKETERCARLGLRGINMTSDPQDLGSPDLANRAWDPLWEICADLDMPVHFHIGSSNTAMDFYGKYFWPSQDEYVKPAIGGSMLFLNSARVVINTVFAGIFDRFPKLRMVAVESGIGWVPFILETMDYELWENAPVQARELSKMPSEYFGSNWHVTFWFERNGG
ncbi:MAG: amidohydrolase family protein, partial [Acidimicrobiales bacterium]